MLTCLRANMLGAAIALTLSTTSACAAELTTGGLPPDDPLPRADDRPPEQISGVNTVYGSVETSDGVRLRTLVSMPEGTTTPLNPLFFTQWVSCGSIEYRDGSSARETLATLARETGLALVRVDRAGVGDSEGPACDELDYNTEVQHYIDAFSQIMHSDLIDPSGLYLYGSSLGSTTAPLVAQALQSQGHKIAGIAVQGGGAVTYFERMLNFDRIYLERRPDAIAPQDIHDEMHARVLFQSEYLIKGRHPDEIAQDSPQMAAIRADIRGLEADNQYGRPFAWHQQAAQRNFLAAWAAIDAPVLVVFNEFDQFETRHGHALIAHTVNRLRPGTAHFVELKGLGHSSRRFESAEAAYADEGAEPAGEELAATLVAWYLEQQ